MKHTPLTLLLHLLISLTGLTLLPMAVSANTGMPVSAITVGGTASRLPTGNADQDLAADAGSRSVPQDNTGFTAASCQQDITGDEHEYMLPAVGTCIRSANTQPPFSVQLGKRIGTRNEILGDFDGVRMDYRVGDALRLNGIAGFPALTAEDVFNPSRQLFGISASTDHLVSAWELNGYLVEQQEGGRVTSRSMGSAVRYLQSGHSLLLYLDYDPASGALGTVMASGAVKLPFRTTFSATLDHQRRSIPVLQQKYLVQSMTVMDGWDWILPSDRLALHTAGGASAVGVLALDLSYALSSRIKLRGDVVLLDVSNEADSSASSESSEYYYHLKITGKDLMIPGDSSKLDLRHSVTGAGHSYSATFDVRYAIKRFWNLASQLRADYQTPADAGPGKWAASPKVKMEYRPSKQFGFHIEAGGNVSNDGIASAANGRTSYFVSLGYQVDF